MPNIEAAANFLDTLNKAHSSVKFTMETICNGMLPFLGIQLLNRSPQIQKKEYVKPLNSNRRHGLSGFTILRPNHHRYCERTTQGNTTVQPVFASRKVKHELNK
ncbi:unnamed protein product [Porites lobata]|uniref:Uncharacterized protein n=1 Tax=Porites lobata TaxID=104759 RepID=A0ABN8NY23_9CNID|nr:unnamed protein product [Porites lobata]